MKIWIEGDTGYPDGFAGGMISRDYPDLGMQGIVADARYTVAAGQTIKIPLPPDILGMLVNQRVSARGNSPATKSEVLPLPTEGQFQWTAPNQGMWEVIFVRHVFRSSPTRFVNREDGTNTKDSRYSLIDYLNPEATHTYLKIIFETYEKFVGDEFGKTILGFRGDEPDKAQLRKATVAGSGQVQIWDPNSGKITSLKVAKTGKNTVSFLLVLEPYESRFIVIGPTL